MQDSQDNYILIGLMNYKLDNTLSDNDINSAQIKFGLRDAVAIRNFHREWENADRRYTPFYHELLEARLIPSSILEEDLNPDILASPLKLDSITHLYFPLSNNGKQFAEAIGYLVMEPETFFFQFERPLLNQPTKNIYRSATFGYLKLQTIIDELLEQIDE